MVSVDTEKCIGCGACAAVCPDGFDMADGKATVKDAKAPCIAEGASSCPVGAISQ